MSDSEKTEPALSSLALVRLLGNLTPDETRHKQAWIAEQVARTLARADVLEDNERIIDLKKAGENQKTRITAFCDTMDNLLGQGLAGPHVPAWLRKKGIEVSTVEKLSRMADRLQQAFEEFFDREIEPLETTEVE